MNQNFNLQYIIPPNNNQNKKRKVNEIYTPDILPNPLMNTLIETPKDPAEIKKQQRIIRNRMSAQLHRERKTAYINNLEIQVREKDEVINSLQIENNNLRKHISELSEENRILRDRLGKTNPIEQIEQIEQIEHKIEPVFKDLQCNDDILPEDSDISSESPNDLSPISSPDNGILSDDSDSNNYFSFDITSDENDFLLLNDNTPKFNSFVIVFLLCVIPFIFYFTLPNLGFGVSSNVVSNNYIPELKGRLLHTVDYLPAPEEAKLNPYDSSYSDPSMKEITEMSRALSVYKNRPLLRDSRSIKRWENNLHDALQQNANGISKSLSDNNKNASYVMCPSAFGNVMLYNNTYDILSNEQNLTNQPFLLLLVPKQHIQLDTYENKNSNDKLMEWVEISCNIVRSRVVTNIGI